MKVEDMIGRLRPRRKVRGIAAALLPFTACGKIAVEAFQNHLRATHDSGLTNAVNMDTGYVNYLTDAERLQVLRWSRDALDKGVNFIAGTYIEDLDGDIISLYRRQMLLGKEFHEKISVYREACRGYQEVLAFEFDQVFAPIGEIFDDETIRGLLEISELKGLKHSSLDRRLELQRLALRDAQRPDFRIYTGNDLGINMIEYGSDYLLGLATFAPDKFAERDLLWETGDPDYYALSDALQYLGNVAFRAPIPAYKHSAATFLHLRGLIPSSSPHPRAPVRPVWEADILRDCAERLGYSSKKRGSTNAARRQ